VEILGEFDDAALMKAFGALNNAIFVLRRCMATRFTGMTPSKRLGDWMR